MLLAVACGCGKGSSGGALVPDAACCADGAPSPEAAPPTDASAVSCPTAAAHWSVVTVPTTANLGGVWEGAPDNVWIGGSAPGTNTNVLLQWNGTAWTPPPLPPRCYMPGAPPLWGTSGAVWVAGCGPFGSGGSGADLWDGTQWHEFDLNDNRILHTIGGSGPKDVWGFDQLAGYLGHWDGTTWTHVDSLHSANGMWASGPTDEWAVGGVIYHFDGTSWSELATPVPHDLMAVSGSSADDVWAVGLQGTLVHFDGNMWSPVASPVTSNLNGVWAGCASDAWAVGDAGVLLHYDGSAWTVRPSATTVALRGIAGVSSTDLWVVGDAGALLHYGP